jgi:hypothetical protein
MILSGGQTGVDRASLDFATAAGNEHGGHRLRTRNSIRFSDATLIRLGRRTRCRDDLDGRNGPSPRKALSHRLA